MPSDCISVSGSVPRKALSMTISLMPRSSSRLLILATLPDVSAGEAVARVVAAGLQDQQVRAIEQEGIEPRQHAGRGVAAHAGVDHLGLDAPGLQKRLQPGRVGLPGRDAEAFRVAGAERHDAHGRRLRQCAAVDRASRRATARENLGHSMAPSSRLSGTTPGPFVEQPSNSSPWEAFYRKAGRAAPWSNAPIAANS